MIDPKQPTIDYRQIMAMPISQRVQATNDNDFMLSVLSSLTPSQIASAFPRYYMDMASDSTSLPYNQTQQKAEEEETKVASLENTPSIKSLPNATPVKGKKHEQNAEPVTLSGTNSNKAYQFFRSKGWSDVQAKGIVANLMGESGHNLDQWKNKGTEDAFGIAQWHKDRRDNFEKVFGHSIYESSLEEQLSFVDWELNHSHKSAGEALRQSNSLESATYNVTSKYEIPANIEGDYQTRLQIAQGLQVEEPSEEPKQSAELVDETDKGKKDVENTQSAIISPNSNATPAVNLEYEKLLAEQVDNSSKYGESGTSQKQGLQQSLARMHPEYLRRASIVQKQLKEAGLPAYLYSNYRPKEYGVNNSKTWSSDKSMHGFGLASDWGGITGKNGKLLVTPDQYKTFVTIMESNGFYRPWKSAQERNHWQITPQKTVDNPEIIKLRNQWAASNYSDPELKRKLDLTINQVYNLGKDADSLLTAQNNDSLVSGSSQVIDSKQLIERAKQELSDPQKVQQFETRDSTKNQVLSAYADKNGLDWNPTTQQFTQKSQATASIVPSAHATSSQQVTAMADLNPSLTQPLAPSLRSSETYRSSSPEKTENSGPAIEPIQELSTEKKPPVPSQSPIAQLKPIAVQSQPYNPNVITATSSVGNSSIAKAYNRASMGGVKGLGDNRGV